MTMLGLSEGKFIRGMDGLEKEEGESGRGGEWERGRVGEWKSGRVGEWRGKGNAVESMVWAVENVRSH